VKFKGTFPHEQIGAILRGAHLCVVPSIWYESAPLVLCSALAAGTPVMVSDLGGLTEVVQQGVNGFSFECGAPASLAKLIGTLLDDASWFRKRAEPTGNYRTPDVYAADIQAEYRKHG
jgi:glycosyltransferase involved in cell wall biosynthesis